MPYLAAVTPPHYQIEVVDENIEPFVYREADIVGITAFTSTVYRAYQIAKVYRKRNIPTVMGGIHVSMMPEEALCFCDTVVIGEAESIWPKLLEDFEKGRMKKQYEGSWADLKTLPIPRRDILKNPFYRWGSIQTSRGCPMNCAFCSVTAFNGRRFRRRPLEAVIEELREIPQRLVLLADDNIIGYGKEDVEWARAFFSRILEKGIKKTFLAQTSILFGEDRSLVRLAAKAGLKIVFVGMESVNKASLRSYRKAINLKHLERRRYQEVISTIRKEGIIFYGAFVIGSDDEDISVFYSTLKFVKSSHIDVLQVTKLTPLPGTRLWNSMHAQGRILYCNFPKDWQEFRLTRMVFKPTQMTIADIYEGFIYLRKSYFSLLETVKRTLFTLFATRSLTSTLIAYKLNSSYRKTFRRSARYRAHDHPGLKKKFFLARVD